MVSVTLLTNLLLQRTIHPPGVPLEPQTQELSAAREGEDILGASGREHVSCTGKGDESCLRLNKEARWVWGTLRMSVSEI